MFIRRRKAKGRDYFAVVRSYREAGRIKHEQVMALGTCPTIEDAIKACRGVARRGQTRLARLVTVFPGDAPRYVELERAKIAKMLALQEQRLQTLADMRARMARRSANGRDVSSRLPAG